MMWWLETNNKTNMDEPDEKPGEKPGTPPTEPAAPEPTDNVGADSTVMPEVPPAESTATPPSHSEPGEVPPGIRRWNWGAFLLSWVWGIAHGVWISLLVFIPVINLVVPFYLGLKGNELAWKTGRWTDVDAYLERQKKWAVAGVIVAVISIIITAYLVYQAGKAVKTTVETVGTAIETSVEDAAAGRQVVDRYFETASLKDGNPSQFVTPSFEKYMASKKNDAYAAIGVPAQANDCHTTGTGISIGTGEMKVNVPASCTDGSTTYERTFELTKVDSEWKINYVRSQAAVPTDSPPTTE